MSRASRRWNGVLRTRHHPQGYVYVLRESAMDERDLLMVDIETRAAAWVG